MMAGVNSAHSHMSANNESAAAVGRGRREWARWNGQHR
jgi:hypothetical protein